MDFPHISIKGGPLPRSLRVAINDQPLDTVTAFHVSGEANSSQPVRILIELLGTVDIDVDGRTLIKETVFVDTSGKPIPLR